MGDDVSRLNAESRDAWDANAAFWDERMGEGNDFHLELVWPATERLLQPAAGQRVLDVGCGNGLTSRRLAAAGLSVTGIDISSGMLERARARTTAHDDRIEYRLLDCTDESALRGLGEHRFDAALSNMVLHDMADIEPLFRGLRHVLKRGAPFVFSQIHPAFNGSHITIMGELNDLGDHLERRFSVKVSGYMTPTVTRGIAIDGQPRPQPYFNRPLHVVLAAAFGAGFVVDGLEERAFPPEKGTGRLAWDSLPEIPPVLVVRVRSV